MPTITTFADYLVTNLGPVTTTFTAPASCYTGTDRVIVIDPDQTDWHTRCDATFGYSIDPCSPLGTQSDAASTILTNPPAQLLVYYSPGVACPSAWTTAGIAAKNTDGHLRSVSGVFDLTNRPKLYYDIAAGVLYEQILAAGETVVACCPSGYTAKTEDGYCYSVLPSSVYQPTAGASLCAWYYPPVDIGYINVTLTSDGVAATATAVGVTGTSPVVLSTKTIPANNATKYVGENRFDMMMLVHKASDVNETAPETTSNAGPTGTGTSPSGSAPTGTKSTAAGPSSSNPASSLRPAAGGILGAWPVAVVATALATLQGLLS